MVEGEAIRSAAGLMNDGAGYFASNGRLFVEAGRFIAPATATAWRDASPAVISGLTTTGLADFTAGTPIGYAPQNAPVGGWGTNTVASKLGTAINNLYR